jgi:SOS-response transcriptional repressor LexA
MDSVELVKFICKERKIPISKLERDLDFSNGYIRRLKNGNFPSGRLRKIADYLGLSVNFLLGIPENDIDRDMKLQEIFEASIRIDGWEITVENPAEGRPCAECIERSEVNGEPLWSLPDGKEPWKLCDICVLHDTKHILTKGDLRLVFSNDEYMDLINRAQNETIESVIRFHEEDSDEQNYRIPVLRRVAAGRPLDAADEILDWIEIPERLISNGTYFGLQIRGDSMEPNIKDGDYVICREQPNAETGEVAVVLINDSEGVCKRIKKYENGKIALMSDNPTYEPMYFDTHSSNERVVIRGIVKWSIRSY